MTRDIDILAMGEPLYELARRADGTYLPGFGGDTSNCVIAAARHGARTAYISAVGSDPFGEALLDLWRTEGVDATSVTRSAHAPTGIYFVIATKGGHEFIYRRQGSAASLIGPDNVPAGLIQRSRILHVSGISQAISRSALDAVAGAIEIAKACGTLVSYDTNYRALLWPIARAREVAAWTLARADFALPSLEDMGTLFGAATPEEAVDCCLELGAGIVALTMAGQGAMIADRSRRQAIPALPVEAVDTTGAGDAFDGAFLAAYLRERDFIKAARYACVAASLSTQRLGAVAGLPTRAETERALGSISAIIGS